jgi:hypothetical protein
LDEYKQNSRADSGKGGISATHNMSLPEVTQEMPKHPTQVHGADYIQS